MRLAGLALIAFSVFSFVPATAQRSAILSLPASIDIEANIDSSAAYYHYLSCDGQVWVVEESAAVRNMIGARRRRLGKPLPMRVLLRYNFTKVDKDD